MKDLDSASSPLTSPAGETHAKEEQFHDEWARGSNLGEADVLRAFEAPTAQENRFIVSRLGDLRGKRLLDVGAGLGESSVRFALLGADVTALDLSPGMLEVAARLAGQCGVKITTVHSPGENLAVESASFDVVYIANTIHHVTSKRALLAEIHRVLRPGGAFYSWDPLKYNPVINLYRRLATKVRTDDESPLGIGDLALMREFFPDLQHREFWFLTQALFLKYFLLDRVHPNADRYWKRILSETDASLRWWRPLQRLDEWIARIPGVRWLAWNTVAWGTKPHPNNAA